MNYLLRITQLLIFCLCFSSSALALTLNLRTTLRSSEISSPKSAIFSPDGSKFFINALEGFATLVFDTKTLKMTNAIYHKFGQNSKDLFVNGESTAFDYPFYACQKANNFWGKPVEFAFSHQGRYLWVSYYRRSCDNSATSPSAIALIDTNSESIIRVIPTGPIPKILAVDPSNTSLAVTHWGDNTVGLLDISKPDPHDFAYKKHITIGNRLNLKNISGNRDKLCGLCLRGTAFTKDGKFLLISGMHTNLIYVYDVEENKLLGHVRLPIANPRHLMFNNDGTKLYISFNIPGRICELTTTDILKAAKNNGSCKGRTLYVGPGARTLTLSQDNKHLYVVCNHKSELVCVDVASFTILARCTVPPYAVGLAVNPSETMAIVTSQGKNGHGGHVVSVVDIVK